MESRSTLYGRRKTGCKKIQGSPRRGTEGAVGGLFQPITPGEFPRVLRFSLRRIGNTRALLPS